jgi:hypothetical protein
MDSLVGFDFSRPSVIELFREHFIRPRKDSAAFLIWFLENYYLLETVEAIEAVSDQGGDKGVDGIVVNDNAQTITVFASRIFDSSDKKVGEEPFRTLAGSMSLFKSRDSIESIIATSGDGKIAQLAKRFDLATKVADEYEVRGVLLCNAVLHKHGEDFMKASKEDMQFVGREYLVNYFVSSARETPIHTPIKFSVRGAQPAEYSIEGTTTIIVPIKASELVKMDGIANQSLFHHNVRGPLGNKTAVNKAIIKTISEPGQHKWFPLFHNGVTIIAKQVSNKRGVVSVEDYYVVNGCQSITALFENKTRLTPDLRILTKFIQVEPNSEIALTITKFSNNQNGVTARDFKSNHRIQIRLQNDMKKHYDGSFFYRIKQGEKNVSGTIIENNDAGLLLTAFDLKEPWTTHRRYQVFEERHGTVFGDQRVNAHRIVMCYVISDAITSRRSEIKNQLFAQYRIATYFLVYVIRLMLERDETGQLLLDSPELFVQTAKDRDNFRTCINAILDDLILDLNFEMENFGEDFDYRDKLRDKEWVKKMGDELVKQRIKQTRKPNAETFKTQWAQLKA